MFYMEFSGCNVVYKDYLNHSKSVYIIPQNKEDVLVLMWEVSYYTRCSNVQYYVLLLGIVAFKK